jgi:hypothetical protein
VSLREKLDGEVAGSLRRPVGKWAVGDDEWRI